MGMDGDCTSAFRIITSEHVPKDALFLPFYSALSTLLDIYGKKVKKLFLVYRQLFKNFAIIANQNQAPHEIRIDLIPKLGCFTYM